MFGGKYQSPGMLGSAVELGVGADADGILLLDSGRPGQPIHEVLELDAILAHLDPKGMRPGRGERHGRGLGEAKDGVRASLKK